MRFENRVLLQHKNKENSIAFIRLSEKKYEGKPALELEKEIGNKKYVVAYVSRKHHDISVITMYKKRSLAIAENADALSSTSETTNSTASDTIIADGATVVNSSIRNRDERDTNAKSDDTSFEADKNIESKYGKAAKSSGNITHEFNFESEAIDSGTSDTDVANGFDEWKSDAKKDVGSKFGEVAENNASITPQMTDAERFEILKEMVLSDVPAVDNIPEAVLSEIESSFKEGKISSWDDINKYHGGLKRTLLQKIAMAFGTFKKYTNSSINVSFEFTGNGFRESYGKQKKNFEDFAKMFSVFDKVIENAVGIEVHNRNKEGYKPDATLKNVYVLASVFKDGSRFVPVKLEVKEFGDKSNTLYVAISLDKIKETEVSKQGTTENGVAQNSRSVNISIRDIFKNVNPSDIDFLKYIPDGFLNEEQLAAKKASSSKVNAGGEINKADVGSQVPNADNSPQLTPEMPLDSSSASDNVISPEADVVNTKSNSTTEVEKNDREQLEVLGTEGEGRTGGNLKTDPRQGTENSEHLPSKNGIITLKKPKGYESAFKKSERIIVGKEYITNGFVGILKSLVDTEKIKTYVSKKYSNISENDEFDLTKYFTEDANLMIAGDPKVVEVLGVARAYSFKIDGGYYIYNQQFVDAFAKDGNTFWVNPEKPNNAMVIKNSDGESIGLIMPIRSSSKSDASLAEQTAKNHENAKYASEVLEEKKQNKVSKSEEAVFSYSLDETENNFSHQYFSPSDDVIRSFTDAIDSWLSGNMKSSEYFELGETPTVLKELGAKDLPVIMTQDVIVKITGEKHSISFDEIKKLPEAIHDPIMVFDSATVPGAFVVVTELSDKSGSGVVIALHINKKQDRISVNRIASVYGKNNIESFIDAQYKLGNLKYIDKEKSQQWSTSRGLQLPKLVQSITDNSSILQKSDIVNTSSERNSWDITENDADYMSAVDNGDMATAQRMVDEAAKKAGYTIEAYHGTHDPVTYDNDGNIISLSERFKTEKNDIRYSNADDGMWHPDLSKAQLQDLLRKIRHDIETSTNSVTDTANWMTTTIDGVNVFAIYSTEDVNNPTLLYESKGEAAVVEREILSEIMEDINNGRNGDEKSAYVGWVFGSGWMLSNRSAENDDFGPLARKGGNRNAGVLQGQSKSHTSRAFRNVIENLFEVQRRSDESGIRYSLRDDGKWDAEDVLRELGDAFGYIPKGENPARDIDVPKKTAEDKPVSHTVRTVLEAKATPDKMILPIAELIKNGDFSYDVYTDEKAISDAEASIKKIGWADSYKKWSADMENGIVFAGFC